MNRIATNVAAVVVAAAYLGLCIPQTAKAESPSSKQSSKRAGAGSKAHPHTSTSHGKAARATGSHKSASATKPGATKTVARSNASQPAQVSGEAGWVDVTTGFAMAKKTNKPIIADFYTDWCGWCKVMDRETFHNPEVEKLLATNFILVKANAEDGGAAQQLAERLRIDGYPTIGFFDASGSPKGLAVGYKDPDSFKTVVNKFLAGKLTGNDN